MGDKNCIKDLDGATGKPEQLKASKVHFSEVVTLHGADDVAGACGRDEDTIVLESTFDPSITAMENSSVVVSKLYQPSAELKAARERKKIEIKKMMKILKDSEKVDLCFLVDCTGSMQRWIDSVKKGNSELSRQMYANYENCDLRIAFVRYTDFDVSKSNRITYIDFTRSESSFQSFVGAIQASGGGDAAEDIMGALSVTFSKLSWRDHGTKVLLHIADAPCHGSRFHNDNVGDDLPNGDPEGITHFDMMNQVIRHEVIYWFGWINRSYTDKMIDEFNDALMRLSDNQLMIQQFDASDLVKLTDRIFASVAKSISASANARSGKRTRIREYKLDPTRPNFGSMKESSATGFEPTLSKIHEKETKDLFQKAARDSKVKVAAQPFADGTEHIAFHATIDGKPAVLKQMKREACLKDLKEHYYTVVEMQMEAQNCANAFNRAKPSDVQELRFASVHMLEVDGQYFIAEDFIDGRYQKFNTNSGWVARDPQYDTLQAFSHFTWVHSRKKMVICDLQGVQKGTEFLLTDPAFHHKTLICKYGGTNLAGPGIQKFFRTHTCNRICVTMKLEKYSR